MRLYGYWRSTATWRVRIALAHKGLAYEYVPVNIVKDGGEQHHPDFAVRNPMRHVPVLEIVEAGKTHHIAESLAILELLEERSPTPPLLPKDPFLRARARQIALSIVSGIQPLQNTKVQKWLEGELHVNARDWCDHWVTLGLDAVETLAKESRGTYLVGDALSFADLCLVPQLNFARRFGIDLSRYETLLAVEKACVDLPSFKAAHSDAQPDREP